MVGRVRSACGGQPASAKTQVWGQSTRAWALNQGITSEIQAGRPQGICMVVDVSSNQESDGAQPAK